MSTDSTKYGRTYHFPFSPGTTSDDRISKEYNFLENKEIVITEKLDGQNDGMNKYGVYARSHATFTEHPWDRAIWDIHARVKHMIGDDEFIFGENMYAIHSLHYKALESYYYIFGIRVKDEWLSWDDTLEYAYCLNLPTVPVLYRGTTDDIKTKVLDLVTEPSKFDAYCTKNGNPMMEGVVVRNTDSFMKKDFATNLLKWVRKDHVSTDVHWTRNWKRQPLKFENNL
jgi:hypothetical protein